MEYVRVPRHVRCSDCNRQLFDISHFKVCPDCHRASCCDTCSHCSRCLGDSFAKHQGAWVFGRCH